MESNLLETYLTRLRLPTIARSYLKVAQEAAGSNLPYERYLLALAEQEVLQRDQNAFAHRMKRANFPVPKSSESFGFSASPGLDKQWMLQLAEGHWIENAEAVILVGNPGVGKSHCRSRWASKPAGAASGCATSAPRDWPPRSWRPRLRWPG